jgi:hypothetical protein
VAFVSFVARTSLVAALFATVATGPAAFEQSLGARAIDEAIAIGLTRVDAERARFHRPYRSEINIAPVDWIDIVTPFRRVMLEAEARTRNGGRLFGQRDAYEALGTTPGRVSVIVELTFHPMNTFVGVPLYEVSLARGADSLAPLELERIPRFGPRVSGVPLPYPWNGGVRLPGVAEPLTGGTLVAQFDGSLLVADGVYDVVVHEPGRVIARARVSLGAVR